LNKDTTNPNQIHLDVPQKGNKNPEDDKEFEVILIGGKNYLKAFRMSEQA